MKTKYLLGNMHEWQTMINKLKRAKETKNTRGKDDMWNVKEWASENSATAKEHNRAVMCTDKNETGSRNEHKTCMMAVQWVSIVIK